MSVRLNVNGASYEVAVKPQVSGIIESIRVEPGHDVKRGDLLASIRVVPNTAALAAAESRVNQARLRSDDAAREFAVVGIAGGELKH